MKRSTLLITTIFLAAGLALAQAPTAAPAAAAITTNDIKNVEAPKADARAQGDPDGDAYRHRVGRRRW